MQVRIPNSCSRLAPACADASVVTPSANVSEPIVRVTLRISTTAGNMPIVVSELQASVANSTAPFVQGFRSKGHNVSTIFIDSITPSYVSSNLSPLPASALRFCSSLVYLRPRCRDEASS